MRPYAEALLAVALLVAPRVDVHAYRGALTKALDLVSRQLLATQLARPKRLAKAKELRREAMAKYNDLMSEALRLESNAEEEPILRHRDELRAALSALSKLAETSAERNKLEWARILQECPGLTMPEGV